MKIRFTNRELGQIVEYLFAENRIHCSKLFKRIELTSAEQAKFVKLGKPLGEGGCRQTKVSFGA